ncbi:MAG: ATP-binding protein [Oscillospiraceae bacterium]|nr:ATP-binding protein [Oscillospiraceae bacterium]
MKNSIFKSICLAATGVFLASLLLIMSILYTYFSDIQLETLKKQTELVSVAVQDQGISFLKKIDNKDFRITLIESDGDVLYDTVSPADSMENHLGREEIREALAKGYGESTRYSSTLLERQIYTAKLLPDGTVIRLSETHYSVLSLILMMTQPIAIVAVIAAVLSLILASRLSEKIIKPLNELNIDKPELKDSYEELKPLIERINSQQRQLKSQSAELRRKQEEFNAATYNMNEGIVLLNETGTILSINHSASKILSASKYCIGKDILLVNRSIEIQNLLNKAQSGEHADVMMNINGLEYQINASPVVSDDSISGIALIIFDITEKEKAEQMRREFSANVSHELKTPLHSISGYAELMKNGLVKENDIVSFSSRIYSEAQRMIVLVDDIIKLSRLDEGTYDMELEETDLFAVAHETVDILKPAADAKNLTVTLNGGSSKIYGFPQLLNGLVYNLCDNAIKYNRQNGSVDITVIQDNNKTILTVSDNGIGIPKEHQERIFERFYRVDKSHSKEVGGTGLGLSIVKHAARLHDAEIKLESVPDGGTTISVIFPEKSLL